jgi:hypothetical protein
VLSYAGQLNITAVADRGGCPDVEVFAQGARAALDDLAAEAAGDLRTGLGWTRVRDSVGAFDGAREGHA